MSPYPSVVNATVEAGSVSIVSDANATIVAETDSAMQAAGGGFFNTGGTMAAQGVIVTNNLRGAAEATISGSSVTTDAGDVSVSAKNRTSLTADNSSLLKSGDTAVGVNLAYNTVGYEPADLATATLDLLIGVTSGAKDAAVAEATITNTTVSASGGILVDAANEMELDSSMSNESLSEASGFTGASGQAASAIFVSNIVAGGAVARIQSATNQAVSAGGAVNVRAKQGGTLNSSVVAVAASETDNTNAFSASDSIAVGLTIARNDLEGEATAEVDGVDLTGATVTVHASQAATVTAVAASEMESSGGNTFGGGTSLAAGGIVAANTVRGSADAEIKDSSVVTTAGPLLVHADNSVNISATNRNQLSSGNQAAGFVGAFNTLGYESQNVLYASLDAVLGTQIGNVDRASANAFITDSDVDATGDVTVEAVNSANLTSEVSNAATGEASG
ncbi:MAG: hypothetical protein MI807_08975, partial [Verrucomicrobiales bacterium]|nr:hypothetical protein [Verrucomicrobiales bacterium]